MASPKNRQIAQRKTLLAVGEGKSEVAFLKHLKSVYCSKGAGVAVSIRNANGKGPSNVIGTALGAIRIASYDKKLCLLDTDLEWSHQNKSDAKRKKIELIGSAPCLEGLLLRILQRAVPSLSDECKKQLMTIAGKGMFEPEDYSDFFKIERLQEARSRIPELDLLLSMFEGKS
jgi:hypothetical protein